MRNTYFIAGIVLGLGIALFALQNGIPTSSAHLSVVTARGRNT